MIVILYKLYTIPGDSIVNHHFNLLFRLLHVCVCLKKPGSMKYDAKMLSIPPYSGNLSTGIFWIRNFQFMIKSDWML